MENPPKLNYYFNFDIYASTPNFYFKNHDRINTCFGTFLTAVYIIASLTLFIFYLLSIIQRKNFKVYDSTIYGQEMPIIDLNSSSLYFAFGMEEPQSMNRFIDDSIYIPKIVFVDKAKINDELVTVYQENLEFERCNVKNFGDNYQHLFLEGELNNSYCLKNFNLTLAGGMKYERFSYIRIRIYPCVNTTENNNSCSPQEEIDRYMSSGYFSIIFKDIGLNPSNYSYPIIPTLQDLYTTIDKRIYKNYILNLGITEVHTDKGLFTEESDVKKYLQFRKELQTFTFRDEEEYYSGKSVIIVQLKLEDNIIVQKRSYTKIPELFSTIGGYMQLMNTAFILLTVFSNKFSLELKILNSIFKFSLKKKDMIVRFKKLNDIDMFTYPGSQSPIINLKKNTNITRAPEFDNKSKNSLIKENDINNISFLNISENKNELEKKSKNSILKGKRKTNLIPFENSKVDQPQLMFSKRHNRANQEQTRENGTNFNIYNLRKSTVESSYKDYNDKITLNMLDYCCCHLIQQKRGKYIQLYNTANSFYRKKLDVVNAFNLMLLTERILFRNNYEYVYSINEDFDISYSKK